MKHFTNPEEKRKYLTEEKIPTLVLNMAVPSIISMLITSFYNRSAPRRRRLWALFSR